jgi:FSR family fosmidomycin resistance protein-like MFS transporter
MQKAVAELSLPAGVAPGALVESRPLALAAPLAGGGPLVEGTVFPILVALGTCHLLNDMMQSLLAALYPMIKTEFRLDFTQIGLITLTFQLTASLLQPLVGLFTDRRPQPYSLALGMFSTLVGLIMLAYASTYDSLLFAAALVGIGSSVFHPEASRVARLASGGRYGLAQAMFQVGGNAGQAIGPLLAALVVLPRGQSAISWFSLGALAGMMILTRVGAWYKPRIPGAWQKARTRARTTSGAALSRRQIGLAIAVLGALVLSKNVYAASLGSYFTFYLIQKFGLSVHDAQMHLFVFSAAVAVGTLLGGPFGDKIGRKAIMWISILGVLPFTLALPYVNLFMTDVLVVIIGLLMASAFPAILVYAQELVPGRVGMIAGIFFGFAFGLGGLGAAVMGRVADATSIGFVYQVCSFLPMLGLLTIFLPDVAEARHGAPKPAAR